MMAGNPNWWSMHPPSLIPPQYVLGSSSIPFNSLTENPSEPTHSWSQLFFAGLPGEERLGVSHFQPKKLEIWDDQIVHPSSGVTSTLDVIKQETLHSSGNLYGHGHGHEEFHDSGPAGSWRPNPHMVLVSSPSSCVTSLCSNNILDFSYNNKADHKKHQLPDHTSECNSTSAGGVCKKARVQPSSCQPPLKVRKEKLGDRITGLHQLVSPFGKTDTASVLLEAIGYIRFLQGQIEALSSPYLGNASNNMRNQQPVHGAERSSVFPEDPGQLLNDNGLKRKRAPNQDAEDKPQDLRSRGLCLVPVSCTQHVGTENGAHYWAPAYSSEF